MISVQPVTGGSESHNKREKQEPHVNKELSHLNEPFEVSSIKEQLADIKIKYTKTTGQKMQAKATPIREAVVLITPENTMDDMKKLASRLEEEFGIRTFQIYIHKDEGHHRSVDAGHESWKPNLHAHMVFNWTDPETGKSLKLDKKDMSRMQDITTEVLNDPYRGVSSNRVHLTALQFKNREEEKLMRELKRHKEELSKLTETLKEKLDFMEGEQHRLVKDVQDARNDFKALRDTIIDSKDIVIKKNALGVVDTQETLKRATAIIQHRNELLSQNKMLSTDLGNMLESNNNLLESNNALRNSQMSNQEQIPKLEQAISKLEKRLELAIDSVHLSKLGKKSYSFVESALKEPGREAAAIKRLEAAIQKQRAEKVQQQQQPNKKGGFKM